MARRHGSPEHDVGLEQPIDLAPTPDVDRRGLRTDPEPPDALASRRERGVLLSQALDVLPGRQRDIILWYFGDGRTFEQIGAYLGCTATAAHKACQRALEGLSILLHSLEDDSSLGVDP